MWLHDVKRQNRSHMTTSHMAACTRSHGKQEIQTNIQAFILLDFRTTKLGWVETYNETWSDQIILLTQKNNFSNEKNFQTHLEKPILHPKKTFLILTRKNNFPSKEKISCNYWKQFSKQKNSKKLEHFVSDVFWIRWCYLLC